MDLACRIAQASKCETAQVGAVIERDGEIIATGHNTPKNGIGCNYVGCSEEGKSVPGKCDRTIHAEIVALNASKRVTDTLLGARMYVTHYPCDNCAESIKKAGIMEVIYQIPYKKEKRTVKINARQNVDIIL